MSITFEILKYLQILQQYLCQILYSSNDISLQESTSVLCESGSSLNLLLPLSNASEVYETKPRVYFIKKKRQIRKER